MIGLVHHRDGTAATGWTVFLYRADQYPTTVSATRTTADGRTAGRQRGRSASTTSTPVTTSSPSGRRRIPTTAVKTVPFTVQPSKVDDLHTITVNAVTGPDGAAAPGQRRPPGRDQRRPGRRRPDHHRQHRGRAAGVPGQRPRHRRRMAAAGEPEPGRPARRRGLGHDDAVPTRGHRGGALPAAARGAGPRRRAPATRGAPPSPSTSNSSSTRRARSRSASSPIDSTRGVRHRASRSRSPTPAPVPRRCTSTSGPRRRRRSGCRATASRSPRTAPSVSAAGPRSRARRCSAGAARHAFLITARSSGAPRFAEGSLTARPVIGPFGTKVLAGVAIVALWLALAALVIPKLANSTKSKQAAGASKSATPEAGRTRFRIGRFGRSRGRRGSRRRRL